MTDLIKINSKNTPITTSLMIAEVFGKRHPDVIRAIKQMYMPAEFRERNFAQSSYINEQNKEQPMYEITKDGFVLLVMGFTGKQATEFKIAYINAFNEMEKTLNNNVRALTSPDLALIGGTVKRCVKSSLGEIISTGIFEPAIQELFNKVDVKRTEELIALREKNKRLETAVSNIQRILLG